MVGTFVLLLAAAVGYGIFNARRLNERGVEVYAVVTRVYSRTEYRNGPGPRGWKHRKKVTAYWLDFRFRVDTSEYEGKCRRSENLMTARAGDSLRVRYLPEDPRVNAPVHREEGSYVLKRTVRNKRRTR
ncbi:MAG: DUF3592 domain-containing protein [Alistipes sp.]|nr:DUF3592 domain-containing protein [Alistipes sp.]